VTPTTPRPLKDDGARPGAGHEARLKERECESQRQYLASRIRFFPYQGKEILLLDLSNCTALEVERIFRATPEVVSARPRHSVLILSDFRGACIDHEAIRVMKETAVFDKPYVRKSAWTGAEQFPRVFSEELISFSRREFHVFEDRLEALAWLAKD
jgi:hypothetical protein